MAREQVAEDLRVLPGHGAADVRQHAGRQSEVGGQRVEVARARAGAGADQHLVVGLGRGELLDDRVDGRAPAIHEALPADLHDARVGQDRVVGRRGAGLEQLEVRQRPGHQQRLQRAVILGVCHLVLLT